MTLVKAMTLINKHYELRQSEIVNFYHRPGSDPGNRRTNRNIHFT